MNIKKITLFIMANLVGLALMAEGYQLNTQSARQLGMGHLGVALKLGSESMLFNPAGLSFMNGKADISLGATGIMSKITYTNKKPLASGFVFSFCFVLYSASIIFQ